MLGKMLIGGDLAAAGERAPLPEGYRYADPRRLRPTELGTLWRRVEGHEGLSLYLSSGRRIEAREEGAGLMQVAVRDQKGGLAGFGGILYKGSWGELQDFVVRPEDRGKGIGKAIIMERLRMAEAAGITSLHVPKPLETNTLVLFYIENGFSELPSGDLVRDLTPKPDGGTALPRPPAS